MNTGEGDMRMCMGTLWYVVAFLRNMSTDLSLVYQMTQSGVARMAVQASSFVAKVASAGATTAAGTGRTSAASKAAGTASSTRGTLTSSTGLLSPMTPSSAFRVAATEAAAERASLTRSCEQTVCYLGLGQVNTRKLVKDGGSTLLVQMAESIAGALGTGAEEVHGESAALITDTACDEYHRFYIYNSSDASCCAAAMRNILCVNANHDSMIDAGVVPALVQLVGDITAYGSASPSDLTGSKRGAVSGTGSDVVGSGGSGGGGDANEKVSTSSNTNTGNTNNSSTPKAGSI